MIGWKFFVAAGVVSCFAANVLAATLTFDSMSNVSTWINPTPAPNTFIGAPFVPAGSLPTTVVGLDAVMVNTGAAINANNLVLNLFFWNSATLATTGLNDAFGNFAGTESVSLGARTIAAGSKNVIQDAAQPGVVPAITLPSSLILNGTDFGVSFNWQVDTGSGLTSVSGLTTAVRAAGVPLAIGTNPIASNNGGYYRNSSNRTDGNFNGADERNNGTSTNVAFRLYSAPEPSSCWLLTCSLVKLLSRRRSV